MAIAAKLSEANPMLITRDIERYSFVRGKSEMLQGTRTTFLHRCTNDNFKFIDWNHKLFAKLSNSFSKRPFSWNQGVELGRQRSKMLSIVKRYINAKNKLSFLIETFG